VRPANPAVDEAAVLTDAQAPKDLLLWNLGHSLRADSIVFEARQKWIHEVIIHTMCIIRTAGPTAEGSSGAFGSRGLPLGLRIDAGAKHTVYYQPSIPWLNRLRRVVRVFV